jgi:hypothetical protein
MVVGASSAVLQVSEGEGFFPFLALMLTVQTPNLSPLPPFLYLAVVSSLFYLHSWAFPLASLLGISDAYYCAECTRLEKDRDGCPKIVNLGASRTDLFYERRRLGEFASMFTACEHLSDCFSGFKKG